MNENPSYIDIRRIITAFFTLWNFCGRKKTTLPLKLQQNKEKKKRLKIYTKVFGVDWMLPQSNWI